MQDDVTDLSAQLGTLIEDAQSVAFMTNLASGIWGEAVRDMGTTTSTLAEEVQAAKVFGVVGKVARVGNIAGNALSIATSLAVVIDNPTAGNTGRLIVSGIAIGANAINIVCPGAGTLVSIGISVADAAWGHYLYDYLDATFETRP